MSFLLILFASLWIGLVINLLVNTTTDTDNKNPIITKKAVNTKKNYVTFGLTNILIKF